MALSDGPWTVVGRARQHESEGEDRLRKAADRGSCFLGARESSGLDPSK
jgi:hypothetical protein